MMTWEPWFEDLRVERERIESRALILTGAISMRRNMRTRWNAGVSVTLSGGARR